MKDFSVVVFCGGTLPPTRREELLAMARDFGGMLAQAGMTCVNGGSGGMMTALCQGAGRAGGRVRPICLAQNPPDHEFITHVELHPHLSPRQHALITAGQAYVALPGGYGTAMEIMDVIARKTLGAIPLDRPLICVGSEHARLKAALVGIYESQFASLPPSKLAKFVATTEAAMDILLAARDAA